jgi:hypothetical protein
MAQSDVLHQYPRVVRVIVIGRYVFLLNFRLLSIGSGRTGTARRRLGEQSLAAGSGKDENA